MSLSDSNDNQFHPFDVNALETLDSEESQRNQASKPDVERFNMLFEKTEFETSEPEGFQALYEVEKQEGSVFFKPLIETEDGFEKKTAETSDPDDDSLPAEPVPPEEPEETPEEKGYKDGFENGYTEGLIQGQEQGAKEGFEKGEIEGQKKGEKQGFEKGEIQGREEGLKAGEEKAEQETREKAEQILASLNESLKTVDTILPLLVEKYEARIIGLIEQIVQKAVLATLEIDDEIVKPMILDALETLVKPEQVELSVCEADYEYIEMVKDDFFEQIDALENVSLKSDSTIKRGGCKIKTNTATIETDPMERLEAIFEAIKNAGTG